MSRPLNRIALVGGIAVLTALGVTQGLRMYQERTKAHREFVAPAEKLAERTSAIEGQGIDLKAATAEAKLGAGNVILAKVPALTQKHRNIFDSSKLQFLSMSDLGDEVANTPELKATFEELAQATEFSSPHDSTALAVINTANHNAERLAVRVLCSMAKHAAVAGDHPKANSYLDAAGRINRYLTTQTQDVSVVAWFGNSRVMASTILEILDELTLSAEQKKLYQATVKNNTTTHTLASVAAGEIARLSQAARGLDQFDELQLMQLNTSGLNDGPLPTHPKAADAMISQVIAFWGEAMKAAKEQGTSAFHSGIIIDTMTREWQKDLQPGNYMLRTMPVTYEQIGRTITRGDQLWQIMNALMAIVCGESAPAGVTVDRQGNDVTVSVADVKKEFKRDARDGLDVDQQVGVRVTVTLD